MKTIFQKGLYSLLLVLFASASNALATTNSPVKGDTTKTQVTDSSSTKEAEKDQVFFRVYMDLNYAYDFDHPSDHTRPFGSNPNHVDQFDIGYSFVEIGYKTQKFRVNAAFNTGGVVDKMYENEPFMLKRIREMSGEFYLNDRFSLEGGIMPAFYGFEGFINKENWFVSRAVMTDFAPDFDLGARLHFRTKTPWRFILQVANGWQTLRETNKNKSVGALVRYEGEKVLVNWGTMRTNESKIDSLDLTRYYSNFFMQFNIGEKLKIAPLWDFGIQKDSLNSQKFNFWSSACLNVRYQWSPKLATSVRGEMFYDPHQIIPEVFTGTPNGFKYYGASFGFDYMFSEHAWIRFEARYAHSKDAVYHARSGLLYQDLVFIGSLQFDIQNKMKIQPLLSHH
jgi:hypothetical protein